MTRKADCSWKTKGGIKSSALMTRHGKVNTCENTILTGCVAYRMYYTTGPEWVRALLVIGEYYKSLVGLFRRT